MRSLVSVCVLASALAAPLAAVAATPKYTDPLAVSHSAKAPATVYMTFVNFTTQEREVRFGDTQYRVPITGVLHVYVPVGAVVRMYSTENPKVNGQALLQVATSDAGRSVMLH